jgi:hypothetical protein
MKQITPEEVNEFIIRHYSKRENKGETTTQMTGVPANSIVLYKGVRTNAVLIRLSVVSKDGKQSITWTRDFVVPTNYEEKMTYVNLSKDNEKTVTHHPIAVQGSLF